MKRIVFALAAALLFASAMMVTADSPLESGSTIVSPTGDPLDLSRTVVFFYSERCPHCHNQMRWMDTIEEDFPGIEFVRYEVDVLGREQNGPYFAAVMEAYDSDPFGWPRTIIGDRVFIGFAPETGESTYNDQYRAWIGYRNALYDAMEELHSALGG